MKTKEKFKSEIELKSEEILNKSRKMNKAYSKYFYFMLNEKVSKEFDTTYGDIRPNSYFSIFQFY